VGDAAYRGPLDAIKKNAFLIERSSCDYICLLSGEHIYRMDYAAMLDFHVNNNADITLACNEVNRPDTETEDVAIADGNRIISLHRARERCPTDAEPILAPMDVAIVEKSVLLHILEAFPDEACADFRLSTQLLEGAIENYESLCYRFGGLAGRVSRDQYWCKLESRSEYYQANMDLLELSPPMDLYQPDWSIRTYQAQIPPARTVPGKSSNEGLCINSIVAGGTVISGGGVNHSVLFPGTRVEDSATVEDSILLSGVVVGEGARLRKCVVEKGVSIPGGESIGYDHDQDTSRFTVAQDGVVFVPKGYRF
jgi:glucose-1-phosphate adenylyltransferase